MTEVKQVSHRYILAATFALLVAFSLYQLWLMWPSLVITSIQWQREVNTQLADLLYDAQSNPLVVGSSLVGFSFIYGMLHSLGPGHGKVIVTTYLATHPTKVRASLILTVVSALIQALVAIALVSILLWFFSASMREVNEKSMLFVSMSYGLVAILGAVICWKAVRQLYHALRSKKPKIAALSPLVQSGKLPPVQAPNNRWQSSHSLMVGQVAPKTESHSSVCGCGHQHVVDASAINKADTWREYIGIVATIGIRPCTGAIMVLLFANVVGLYWMGVMSAVVMAAGTALTTSMIAMLTLAGKHFIKRYLTAGSHHRPGRLLLAGSYLQLCGGLILTVIGLLLFSGQDYGISPVF